MTPIGYGLPDAEDAKVSQKAQKKTMRNFPEALFCDFCVAFVVLPRSAARIQEPRHG